MKIYKGNIITLNDNDNVASYLVENDGKIEYVGDKLPERYDNIPIDDIGAEALIPAFVDSHQHLASFATFNAGLNVMNAQSNQEILSLLSDYVKLCNDRLIIAFGASPYSVEERRLISKDELDRVCADKPIFFVKYDGHACVVNSKLLEKIEKKAKRLRGYHADTGEMNQEAFFAVSNYISASISLPMLLLNLQKAVDFEAAHGIGMIHTVSGVGFAGDLDISLEKLFAMSLRNGFQLRVFPQSMDIRTAQKRKLPRIGGCFECALDGCFGSHDAAMNEMYSDSIGGDGILYYSDSKVEDFCKRANRAGLQIELHAIGDRAFDQATRAIKAALDDYPRDDHRHGIIHDCLPTIKGIELCREYHIQMPVQSAFINWRQEPDDYLERILGKERVSRLNPLRTLWDNGIMLSAGSDAPCTSPDPIVWLDRAVNHSNPHESLNIHEALRMCTRSGYYATFDDMLRGSLEPGKVADMVVLSDNPYNILAEDIHKIKVKRTILAGKDYNSCKDGVVAAFVKGLTGRSVNY